MDCEGGGRILIWPVLSDSEPQRLNMSHAPATTDGASQPPCLPFHGVGCKLNGRPSVVSAGILSQDDSDDNGGTDTCLSACLPPELQICFLYMAWVWWLRHTREYRKYGHHQNLSIHMCWHTELQLCVYVLSFQENFHVKSSWISVWVLHPVARIRGHINGHSCPGVCPVCPSGVSSWAAFFS